ncbi:MAG: PRC-barrel domain-containing protein [Deltaproteobacteria bacterium]|nr:PRC-barrel domain-containing protein [Deltaproteobacteria bacterium]
MGLPVISQAEASRLGVISAIYLDTAQRRVAAFGISTRRVGGKDMFVPISEVLRVGRDVVLISGEAAAREPTDSTPPPGRRTKDLQGVRVTTMEGRHLGTVEDFCFSTDWVIAEVALSNHKVLFVAPASLTIADEILVPADADDRIREDEYHLDARGRSFARAALRDTTRMLKRAWSWRGSGKADDLHDGRHEPR